MTASSSMTALLALATATACNFPRPAGTSGDTTPADATASGDVGDSVDATSEDAPEEPGTAIRVSPSGDDANDGLTKPVKTLKHAIGLAVANSEVTRIILASGRYSTATGETFPYAIPVNLTVVGPLGGGAILAGTKSEAGVTIGAGVLRDLEFEDFVVAITVTGTARLTSIRVRTSKTAIRAEASAVLAVDTLDIAGAASACATGIELNGAASLNATGLMTTGLGQSLVVRDRAAAQLSEVNVSGDVSCTVSVMLVTSTSMFMLSESLLDTGLSGITIGSPTSSTPTPATLVNTTIRNMRSGALNINNAVGEMRGGELSRTQETSLNVGDGGQWSMIDVDIINSNGGVYSQGARVTFRNCTISDNLVGIDIGISVIGDLGTISNPGNNTIKNSLMGLIVESGISTPVQAVGNIWKPVQGADAQGRYPVGISVSGPVTGVSGNNFEIWSGSSVQF